MPGVTAPDHDFLTSFAAVLCVAAVTTVISQRLRLPVVLGYLIAGVIIGPHAPPLLVADAGIVTTLSELGVILLMFYIGMELSLRKLAEVGGKGFAIALVEMGLMLWLGYFAGQLMGLNDIECAFLAGMLAISSTTIIARTFEEQKIGGRLREQVYGALVMEDVFAILIVALLTTLAVSRSFDLAELAATAGRLGIFLSVLVIVGLLMVPRLIRFVVALARPETTLVSAVGVCFAAALAAQSFGYSVALGAFLAGCLVAESGESKRIAAQVRPLRDIFAAVFFVSVGMSIDPVQLWAHAGTILGLVLLVVVGKFVGVTLGFFATGSSVRLSAQAGLALGQIGEFSFIIAALGTSLGAIDAKLFPIAVGVSAITVLITPFAVRHSGALASRIEAALPKPLQTFAALYASWIEQLQRAREAGTAGARVRKYLRLIALDALLLVALVIAVAVGGDEVVRYLKQRLDVAAAMARWLVVAGAIAISLPFVFGLFRLIRVLGRMLATAALPDVAEGQVDFAQAPRRAFVVSLQLGITMVVALPCLAILQPFLPEFKSSFVLLGLVLIAAIAFWRSATQLQGHVRAGAQALVEAVAVPEPGKAGEALDQMEQLLPGMGDLGSLVLAAGHAWIGRSLGEIDLRGLTGATVLAIRRGPEALLTPDGRSALHLGDVLVIAGSGEALQAARGLFRSASAPA